MVNLKYISSNGKEFDLHDFDSAKLFKADFHKVEWTPEVTQKQYGTTINRFKKPAQKYDCTFRFKGDQVQRKTQIDDFIFETENDIAKVTPGRIYWNNQYIEVYFDSHDCYPIDSGIAWTELEGIFYAPFPFWLEDVMIHIDPEASYDQGGVLPEDVKGYPLNRDISYAYTYSYPYDGSSGVIFVDSPIGADFSVVVYGPVSGVKINIAGNNYQINYPLRLGQRLIVDSRDTLKLDKKCYVINEDETETNVFDYRDPTSSLFKRIPGGNVVIYSNTPYKMDLTVYLERSAPI